MNLDRKRVLSGTFLLALIFGNVWVLERLYSQQSWALLDLRETLLVSKRRMEINLMGSDFFLRSRSAIAQGQLHLDRWSGYQEIVTAEKFDLRSLHLSGAIHRDGSLSVFRKDDTGFIEGFRVSPKALVHYRATPIGEWVSQEDVPITLPDSYSPGILNTISAKARGEELPEYPVELELDALPGAIRVSVNGKRVKDFSVEGQAGFWAIAGGFSPVTVDELTLLPKSGVGVRENFEPPLSFPVLITLGVIFAMVGTFLWWIQEKSPRFSSAVVTGLYGFFACFFAVFLVDRYHFSNFQFELFGPPPNQPRSPREAKLVEFEQSRHRFFQSLFREPITDEAFYKIYPDQIWRGPIWCVGSSECRHGELPPKTSGKGPRLLVVGTSQTFGVGASRLENTFFVKLHRALVQKSPGLQSLNIAVLGATPTHLLEKTREALGVFSPDILIINLGYNAPNLNEYRSAMKGFTELPIKAQVFIVNEAAVGTMEKMTAISAFNRHLSEIHGYQVIPLYQSLAAYTEANRENLWWDVVHLNDLGNELIARILIKEVQGHHVLRATNSPVNRAAGAPVSSSMIE